MRIARDEVLDDAIDGLPAHGDRAPPRRAKGKEQGQAETITTDSPPISRAARQPLRRVSAAAFPISATTLTAKTTTLAMATEVAGSPPPAALLPRHS